MNLLETLISENDGLINLKKKICNTLDFEPQNPDLFFECFTPSSTILSHINDYEKELPFACYTIELEDDHESILESFKLTGVLLGRGGGVGIDFSNVREHSVPINGNKHILSGGILLYAKLFESVVSTGLEIGDRKSTGCMYLDISHPEIFEFIKLKRNMGDINLRTHNLNIGVKIPDKFMHAVLNNEMWNLVSPYNLKITKRVEARELFNLLIKERMESGAPFIMFTTTCTNMARANGYCSETNPVNVSNLCTEILIKTRDEDNNPELGVCCLGSLHAGKLLELVNTSNQKSLVSDIHGFFNKLFEYVKRLLENNSKLKYLKPYFEPCLKYKNIGVGVFGYAAAEQENPTKDTKLKTLLCSVLTKINDTKDFTLTTAIAPTNLISKLHNTTPCLENYPEQMYTQNYNDSSTIVKREKTNYPFQYDMNQKDYIDLCQSFLPVITQSISCTLHYNESASFKEVLADHIYAWKSKLRTLYYVRMKKTNIDNLDTDCKITCVGCGS